MSPRICHAGQFLEAGVGQKSYALDLARWVQCPHPNEHSLSPGLTTQGRQHTVPLKC